MTETAAASIDSRLRLRDSAMTEDRDGEIAVYLHDLGGGSVLRGVPALMFRSVHGRFGTTAFTVGAAAEDERAGDIEKWRSVLAALTDRGILVSEATKRGTVSAPERLLVQVDGSTADAARLAELVSSASSVDVVADGAAGESSPATKVAVRLDHRLDTVGVLAFAREQATGRTQSLTVRTYGDNVELGPWTVPGRTPCFECYWSRLQAGRDRTPPRPFLQAAPPTPRETVRTIAAEAAITLVASEIIKAAAGAPPVTMGQVVRLELATLELVKHKVVSVPVCPTCAAAFRADL